MEWDLGNSCSHDGKCRQGCLRTRSCASSSTQCDARKGSRYARPLQLAIVRLTRLQFCPIVHQRPWRGRVAIAMQAENDRLGALQAAYTGLKPANLSLGRWRSLLLQKAGNHLVSCPSLKASEYKQLALWF